MFSDVTVWDSTHCWSGHAKEMLICNTFLEEVHLLSLDILPHALAFPFRLALETLTVLCNEG